MITRYDIMHTCQSIMEMLLDKNEAYGNSAFEPVRIFSNCSPVEQIKVRIDDKLSRLLRGTNLKDQEDTVTDLIGYLILLKTAMDSELSSMDTNPPPDGHDEDLDSPIPYYPNGEAS